MKIVLLGAPGSGKGTLSEFLKQHLNIPHISTGDIFRVAMAKQTELGLLAKSFIDYGNLVPDDVTIALVKERLKQDDCKAGFILDGFPRTEEQAVQLNKFCKLDAVIYLNISLQDALRRLLNRRVCKECNAIYNLLNYDKQSCAKCGGELITRKDDTEETIVQRFNVYKVQTYPVVEYYDKLQALNEIKVTDIFEENRANVMKVIGESNDF